MGQRSQGSKRRSICENTIVVLCAPEPVAPSIEQRQKAIDRKRNTDQVLCFSLDEKMFNAQKQFGQTSQIQDIKGHEKHPERTALEIYELIKTPA
jgi:hypothetical protein